MKKISTLSTLVNSTTADELSKIIDNENVSVSTLTENEKLAVLIFSELKKSLQSREYELTLDCNYKKSKNKLAFVDYYRLVDKSSNASLIQLYVSCSVKSASCHFRLCTSCAESVREQMQSLKFIIKYDKRTLRAKTSERRNVDYTEVCYVVKSVCAVLTNTAQTAEQTAENTAV